MTGGVVIPGKADRIQGSQNPRIVVAPRLPERPKEHTGNPFTTIGDIVADCAVVGCGYHVMGPRMEVKQALDEHKRQFHYNEISVVLLNHVRQ